MIKTALHYVAVYIVFIIIAAIPVTTLGQLITYMYFVYDKFLSIKEWALFAIDWIKASAISAISAISMPVLHALEELLILYFMLWMGGRD
jgi:hypothetical protein